MNGKIILGFVGGLILGGLGGWLGTKQYYKEIADEQISELEAYYKEKENKLKEQLKETQNAENEASEGLTEAKSEVVSEKPEITKEDKEKYQEMVKDYSGYSKKEKGNQPAYKEPYIISEDEWDDPKNGYDAKTLLYFKGDNTYVDDEDGVVIQNGDSLVGENNINEYDEDGVLYVCNEKYGVNYQVFVNDEAYEDSAYFKG